MRILYIADDGKEFEDEFECEHYEWMLNHPNLKYIKIYDNRTGELFDDIMTDDAYNYGDKVVIPTEFALKIYMIGQHIVVIVIFIRLQKLELGYLMRKRMYMREQVIKWV